MYQDDPEGFVLVKRWVPEYEQDLLWEHTRKIRDERIIRLKDLKLAAKEPKGGRKRASTSRAKSPGLFGLLR